jgi:hypothetical protein
MWHQGGASILNRILLGKPLALDREFTLRLRHSYAAPQSRDHMKEAGGSPPHPRLVVLPEGREHICIAIQLKPGRRNSYDRVGRAVIKKPHTYCMWISPIPLLPQARADDRNRSCAELIVRSFERAAS